MPVDPINFPYPVDCRDGTRAELATALAEGNIGPIEIQRETDTGRFKLGADYVSGRKGAATAPLAAGNTTLRPASHLARSLFVVSPTAGVGTYQHNLIAARLGGNPMAPGETAPMLAYDQLAIRVEMPASANPTLKLYDDDTAGTLLLTIAPDAGVARSYYILLYRTEAGAWAVEFAAQSAAVTLP